MEQIIVKYLQSHRKGLTVKECQEKLGTTELRKRICDLKDKGYVFTDMWEHGVNRNGMPTKYKRYWLLSTPKNN